MNDLYDTKAVLDPHSLVSYRPFTAMLVWSGFFFNFSKMFVASVPVRGSEGKGATVMVWLQNTLGRYVYLYIHCVSKKTGPLLRFEITPTNCA